MTANELAERRDALAEAIGILQSEMHRIDFQFQIHDVVEALIESQQVSDAGVDRD